MKFCKIFNHDLMCFQFHVEVDNASGEWKQLYPTLSVEVDEVSTRANIVMSIIDDNKLLGGPDRVAGGKSEPGEDGDSMPTAPNKEEKVLDQKARENKTREKNNNQEEKNDKRTKKNDPKASDKISHENRHCSRNRDEVNITKSHPKRQNVKTAGGTKQLLGLL